MPEPISYPTPLLSVGLSVLNGGAFLSIAVRSVINQTFQNWELLVVDDGSTDGAVERVRSLSDPRVRVIRDGRNLGLAPRLNQAVTMAKGKYFARMDHDDICHPERFAEQVRFLDEHPDVDVLATECMTIDEQGKLNGMLQFETGHADICARPWRGFRMAHPTWMGRIEWFRQNRYLEPAPYRCEDQELLLRAYRLSRYHTLPKRLLAYRIRNHTSLRKLVHTRAAMLRFQLQYFLGRREWVDAALSCIAGLARIGRDSRLELFYRLALVGGESRQEAFLADEYQEWASLIDVIVSQSNKCARR